MGASLWWALVIFLYHIKAVCCLDDPFLDEFEAKNFLGRSRRSNQGHFVFEELFNGNQERECIEESCTKEEAREIFDNNVNRADIFWTKYRRCTRASNVEIEEKSSRDKKIRIRVAREARLGEKEKAWMRRCISDTDQCMPFPCVELNTLACEDAINDYVCVCKPGYTGRKCSSPVNECLSNPCHVSARCEDEIGGFRCVCDSLHEGILCQTEISDCRNVPSKRCASHGRCLSLKDDAPFKCACDVGYTGALCNQDVNECLEFSPCEHNCTNAEGSFQCSCLDGYILDADTRTMCKDIDECNVISHGCQHACYNNEGGYQCACKPGFRLDNVFRRYCEDIDECEVNNGGCPVIEGGCAFSREPCKTCHNMEGDFTCYCPTGFSTYEKGHDCEDIDECERSNHGCQQGCENFPGGYQCLCDDGYKLNFNQKTCSDINECFLAHGCEYRCVNNVGSYQCTCSRGFKLGEDGHSCLDEDECAGEDTRCSDICINTQGSYACDCKPGYRPVGKYRCSDINDCASSPCGINGRCRDGENSYTCECRHGFHGDHCEIEENPCLRSPCLNEGTCVEEEAGFSCHCTSNYTGDTCATRVITCTQGYILQENQCNDVNECFEDRICEHECKNSEGSYLCICNDGFSVNGNQCNDIDECIERPCEQICSNVPGSYLCSCEGGYHLRANERGCEKIFSCYSQPYRTLSEPHLLLGTQKDDFVAHTVQSLESIFSLAFEYRTFDPDAILLVVTDDSSQRYIYVTLDEGRLAVSANLDGYRKESVETSSSELMLDAQWHKVLLRKRNNRVRISKDGNKLRDLRFSDDGFGSVKKLFYGGLSSEISLNKDTQQYARKRLQGCLRKFSYSGLQLNLTNHSSPNQKGCFETIGPGIYFNGTGYISIGLPHVDTLRMRFNFKSRSPSGTIALVQNQRGEEFSLQIEENQLVAEVTTNEGRQFSSVYASGNVGALCNNVWHVCDVTVSSDRIRLHVDGLEAQTQRFDGMHNITFGEGAVLHLGGIPGNTSYFFTGSLRNLKLNNRPLNLSNPLEVNGVLPYSIPLL